MAKQQKLEVERRLDTVEQYEFEPIKGYPMLHWKGKRPFRGTQYYPAQLKESYGEPVDGWMNRIYWGDNLQVMSHLLKEFRGKVDLVYIDPPFDSKADYKKKISLQGKELSSDTQAFEEKQYTDLWVNDEYLQFIYVRLVLLKELIKETGVIFIHCDWHKSHYIRIILDEIFGQSNFKNEVIWVRSTNPKGSQHENTRLSTFTDTIFTYGKSIESEIHVNRIRIPLSTDEIKGKYHRIDEIGPFYDGPIIRSISMGERPNLVYEYKGYTPPKSGWRVRKEVLIEIDKRGNLGWSNTGTPFRKLRPEDDRGNPVGNFWNDISLINSQAVERVGYPTQKPEELLERIINLASNPGDLVLDCFMGSGTTQAAAMKLGRRFIGADINLGAIQTTTKRLIGVADEIRQAPPELEFEGEGGETRKVERFYTGFEVYNVNQYDIFRNELEAKELLMQALEIQPLPGNSLYDGEKDGRMVKVMPVNRIATRADLAPLVGNFDYKEFERRQAKNPGKPVESLLLVCMGHEPDLKAALEKEVRYKLDVEVVDILRDKKDLQFKREAAARAVRNKKGELEIRQFYPMNLLQKLSMQKEAVEDWRELVESVMVDWNYDGAVFQPTVVDVPGKNELVRGVYPIPKDAGTIRIKITDLLSESLEMELG